MELHRTHHLIIASNGNKWMTSSSIYYYYIIYIDHNSVPMTPFGNASCERQFILTHTHMTIRWDAWAWSLVQFMMYRDFFRWIDDSYCGSRELMNIFQEKNLWCIIFLSISNDSNYMSFSVSLSTQRVALITSNSPIAETIVLIYFIVECDTFERYSVWMTWARLGCP